MGRKKRDTEIPKCAGVAEADGQRSESIRRDQVADSSLCWRQTAADNFAAQRETKKNSLLEIKIKKKEFRK